MNGGGEEGTVKWYNTDKGYGFIVRAAGVDVFLHHTAIVDDGGRPLTEGDRVSCGVLEGPKGLQATNVVRIT